MAGRMHKSEGRRQAAPGNGAPLRIGMIGLDNSRVLSFARMLNEDGAPDHIPGARLVAAWPGEPSADFPMSADRHERYRRELRDRYGVPMLGSIEEVAAQCDAWMLEAVDGRVHEALFERMAAYGKPVFVDKPLALDAAAAGRMLRLAEQAGTPLMSCSALRCAEALTEALAADAPGDVCGADFFGPLDLEATQPGYFWYGIHTADMLFRAMGRGCAEVRAVRTPAHDLVVGRWTDGRIGTIRGFRTGNDAFGGAITLRSGCRLIDVQSGGKPYLASLMEEIAAFFRSRRPTVDPLETWEVIRFLEAANASVREERAVKLDPAACPV